MFEGKENSYCRKCSNIRSDVSTSCFQSPKQSLLSKDGIIKQLSNNNAKYGSTLSKQNSTQYSRTNQQYGMTADVLSVLKHPSLEQKLSKIQCQIKQVESRIERQLSEQQLLKQYLKYLAQYIKKHRNTTKNNQFNSEYFNLSEQFKIVKGQLRKHDIEWIKTKRKITSQLEKTQRTIQNNKERIKSLSYYSARSSKIKIKRVQFVHFS